MNIDSNSNNFIDPYSLDNVDIQLSFLHTIKIVTWLVFFCLNVQVAKNEELGLELVTLLNTKEKLQNDKEAAELETMQVIIKLNTKQQYLFALFMCV